MKCDTVWVVFRSYPALSAVNDDLDISSIDVVDIVGIYGTKEKAEQCRIKLQKAYDDDVVECGCDPVDVVVSRWNVE